MPSAKRARQRAARDEKLAEMEKAKRRSRALRRVIIAIVIAGAITGIVYLITAPGAKPSASSTTTTSSSSTTSSTTTTTQPTVTAAAAPTCPKGSVERHIKFTHAPPTCIDVHATYLATVKTDVGTFVIRLPAAQNPVAVNNFVFLARWHFYNGIIFQRVIPHFMNQGGDPTGTGAGGPGYSWTGTTPKGCTTTRTRGTCYPLGSVAMANSGTTSSNGSQFFIMNTNGYPLPALYTRFGQVTSGQSVIQKIAASGSESGTPTVVHHMISVTISTAPSFMTTACPPPDGSAPKTQRFDAPPPMCIDLSKRYTADLVTNKGTIRFALDAIGAPRTVNNFVFLARYHYFEGIFFHRVIPGFVIQAGDPEGTGRGGPGYRFEDELPPPGRYEVGSLAMANAGPDTNGSQFFVVSGPSGATLPPSYSLFGKAVTGLDVVAAIEAVGSKSGEPSERVVIEAVTITEAD